MTCTCTPCYECDGTGQVWFARDGSYLGKSRCDDLDELECCDICGGDGVITVCEDCHYAWLEEQEREDERERQIAMDRQYRDGFRAGWNAAVIRDEKMLERVNSRPKAK